eukprot:TRINITY_DN26068_c1_g1_i5.p1 TRINITY_DN26068_c1_g1~~TRINITY_DN26068_c1_g1_i5.p1  ORF type:complete len:150 (+),score=9.98 TRINITY_DN26068_c1_g1_i5:329-778(+)
MEIAHPTETMATAAAVAAPVMVDLASPPPPLTSALPCRELTTEPDLRRKLPTVDTVGASLASACKMPSDDVSKGAAAGCNVAPLANIDFDAHAGSRNGRVPVVATPTASNAVKHACCSPRGGSYHPQARTKYSVDAFRSIPTYQNLNRK